MHIVMFRSNRNFYNRWGNGVDRRFQNTTPGTVAKVNQLIKGAGGHIVIPPKFEDKGVHFDLIRSLLKVQHIHRGRLRCILTVKPHVCNIYNTLYGGAFGAIAEIVAIACARTVVNIDKDLFLGELSISYLASAVNQEQLTSMIGIDDIGDYVISEPKTEYNCNCCN